MPSSHLLRYRVPLLAAIGFVALLSASAFVCEVPPQVDASGEAVLAWVRANERAIGQQVWLGVVAWLPGAVLFTLAYSRMRGVTAACYLLGVALSMTLTFVGGMLRLGLMRHASALTAGEARLVSDIETNWLPLATIGNILQAGALCVAVRQKDLVPWLFPVSLMFAAEQAVETVTIVMSGSIWGPGGLVNLAGSALYLVWVLALGVGLSTDGERDAAARGSYAR